LKVYTKMSGNTELNRALDAIDTYRQNAKVMDARERRLRCDLDQTRRNYDIQEDQIRTLKNYIRQLEHDYTRTYNDFWDIKDQNTNLRTRIAQFERQEPYASQAAKLKQPSNR
jgi:chromosome segregation ATPase